MRHPVHQLLSHHAYCGSEPTAAELDALDLSAGDREQVRLAARKALELHADGFQADAHEHAREESQRIIGGLPAAQRDPRYAHRDPYADIDDPAELASLISRPF